MKKYLYVGLGLVAVGLGALGVMTAMVLLSTFVFIPAGSVARIIVPVAGAVGALTVMFFVPNAKNDDI